MSSEEDTDEQDEEVLGREEIILLVHGFVKTFKDNPPPDILDLIHQFYIATCLIITMGSRLVMAGFGMEDSPTSKIPCVIGYSDNKASMSSNKIVYVGDEAESKQNILCLEYPIQSGQICNWTAMEDLLQYVFRSELRINPANNDIFMSEAPLNPKARREKLTEIMFEKFAVGRFYIGIDAVLSLYASGRTTGVVVDCGDAMTSCVPIYEGYALPHAIVQCHLAGKHITAQLIKLLSDSVQPNKIQTVANDIKEKCCYVSSNYRKDNNQTTKCKDYELPDGTIISVNKARFQATEILFQPDLFGDNYYPYIGIHTAVYNCIRKCDVDIHLYPYSNIVLAGGSTMFDGFKHRLTAELTSLAPACIKVHVVAQPERFMSAWIGASILSSLSTFKEMWITKEEYKEAGASIVHRKCF